MIYILGDTHGETNKIWEIRCKYDVTENDYIIVCGDFGFIWNKEYKRLVIKLERIFKGTILFVDGNHENHDILDSLTLTNKFGGVVGKVSDRIYHLRRGEFYMIDGHGFFTFGGADSIDKDWRVPGKSWWERENPSEEEIIHGQTTLEYHLNHIEYVITHDLPAIVRRQLVTPHKYELNYKLPSVFDTWLERLFYDSKSFICWYGGHHHDDVDFPAYKCKEKFKEIDIIEGVDNGNVQM